MEGRESYVKMKGSFVRTRKWFDILADVLKILQRSLVIFTSVLKQPVEWDFARRL